MSEKYIDTQYEELLDLVLSKGALRSDRTGVGTVSMFSPPNLDYDLANGFPLITTKKVHLKSIIHELLWFLFGDTNIKYLADNNVTIWDDWAPEDGSGELGPVYGAQMRKMPNPYFYMSEEEAPFKTGNEEPYIDQIADLIKSLKKNPYSRRHMLVIYNPTAVPYQALPPCHVLGQFYVEENGRLSFKWYQRSSDMLLGLPFNVASYALLVHMVAQQLNREPGRLIVTFGDAHIYTNHISLVALQINRKAYLFPDLKLNRKPNSIFDYKYEDFELVGYESHPAIKAPIAV